MAHRAAITTTFRIATVNVHSFRNPINGDGNAESLADILRRLDLDLLAVEEVSRGTEWTKLQQLLSFSHSAFGPSYGSDYGNAIVSRYPIVYNSNHITSFRCNGGTRSMLTCRLGGDHPFVQNRTFAVTHLDHLNEDDRLRQLKDFAPHRNNINVLIGDMNSVTREDYSDDYYRDIVFGKRRKAGWELPRFDITRTITETFGFDDAFRQVNPELKDEQAATCPYGTRIDYIFLRPIQDDEWVLKECSIIDTQQATDHQAVMATFEYRPKLTTR